MKDETRDRDRDRDAAYATMKARYGIGREVEPLLRTLAQVNAAITRRLREASERAAGLEAGQTRRSPEVTNTNQNFDDTLHRRTCRNDFSRCAECQAEAEHGGV